MLPVPPGRKKWSPLYVAVMMWLPGDSEEMVKFAVAVPSLITTTGIVAKTIPLSAKVTLPPAGVGSHIGQGKLMLALTVAVKVTDWPIIEGLTEDPTETTGIVLMVTRAVSTPTPPSESVTFSLAIA
jgi:hypothetical protein